MIPLKKGDSSIHVGPGTDANNKRNLGVNIPHGTKANQQTPQIDSFRDVFIGELNEG